MSVFFRPFAGRALYLNRHAVQAVELRVGSVLTRHLVRIDTRSAGTACGVEPVAVSYTSNYDDRDAAKREFLRILEELQRRVGTAP